MKKILGGCFVAGTPVRLSAVPALQLSGSFVDQEESSTQECELVPIEQVPLGARVPDQNPRPEDYDFSFREVDQDTWRQVNLSLTRDDGAQIEAELLRPIEWIEAFGIRVGGELPVGFTELETRGRATVTAILPCCDIATGAGSVVTGRFVTRQAGNLVKATLDNGTTFSGTASHPVWLPEENTWRNMGELADGDGVCTETECLRVEVVTKLTSSADVFNIEVHGHHVYRITADKVLVHNNGECAGIGNAPKRSGAFLKGENITKRWVGTLTGKRPDDVADLLARKGWTKSNPQAAFPDKIQHTVFTRTTKAGDTYILDFHPGGGLHQSEYWKVYKVVSGEKVVFGRIGPRGFVNFDQITNSPVFIDGILRN